MDMRKYAGADFIKVDDVRAGPLELKIVAVRTGKYDKPDAVFETGEILSLNGGNTKTLIKAYGPDGRDWAGKEIKLKLGTAPYQGSLVDSVVVEPISPPITDVDKAEATAKLKSLSDDLDDEIPF
jgi:hypothetical protein